MRRQKGIALVVVMAALTLIAFLVLTILTLNRAEHRASINSSEMTDVKNLADLPAQIVISQIRRATQNLGTDYTWTSQPGMIRVFDQQLPPASPNGSDASTVTPRKQWYYLLYSSEVLFADQSFRPLTEAAKLAEWADQPALFVDLNEPIWVRPFMRGAEPTNERPVGTPVFPILDPLGLSPMESPNPRVQGLALTGAAPGLNEANPTLTMPMPVRWLYVLSDGKLLTPLPSSEPTVARFRDEDFLPKNGEPAPKIIGRIAFWTDDESCKLNLNTASEPAPWHPPLTVSDRDRWAAQTQPIRGEAHRLAGHPAFTALSAVVGGFGDGSGNGTNNLPSQPVNSLDPLVEAYRGSIDLIHGMVSHTPLRDAGTQHGTRAFLPEIVPPIFQGRVPFPAVDDLLFDNGAVAEGRPPNGAQRVGSLTISEDDIRVARFCLTTHSSSPESNPFNKPKISLWTMQSSLSERTATDQQMALASSLGGLPEARFHYGLLRASTNSSQSVSADFEGRNRELFDWLRRQTGSAPAFRAIPGYGGAFEEKYGALNRDQLLLSMWDLLRWTVNPGNPSLADGPLYHYLPMHVNGESNAEGAGMVAPLQASSQGITLRSPGRVPTITEAALVFVATDARRVGSQIETEDVGPFAGYGASTTEVRAFLVLEPFVASPGHPGVSPVVSYSVVGLNGSNPGGWANGTFRNQQIEGENLIFGEGQENALVNRVSFSASRALAGFGRPLGGSALAISGLSAAFLTADGSPRNALGVEPLSFPWCSAPLRLNSSSPANSMRFTGGDLWVEIRHGGNGALMQEIVLPLSSLSGDLPVPRLHPDDFQAVLDDAGDDLILRRFALQPHPIDPNAPPQMHLIRRGDVVRSVELNPLTRHRGDVRMVATRMQIPGDWFAPCSTPAPGPEVMESHSLREGIYDSNAQFGSALQTEIEGPREPFTSSGSLLFIDPNGNQPPVLDGALPAVPRSLNGALTRTNPGTAWDTLTLTDLRYGDWETGVGILPDGPYFSRQDLLNSMSQFDSESDLGSAGFFTNGGPLRSDNNGINQTPHRQISSAIAFGALSPWVFGAPQEDSISTSSPTDPEPWRTLLFCPNPASRTTSMPFSPSGADHPGFANPPDHLWLDFFWLPTVDPFYLSPSFSTEGKININFQILPFTWIERSTGLHAALKGVRIPAIPHQANRLYKRLPNAASDDETDPTLNLPPEFLYEVNVAQTLRGMRQRFLRGEVYIQPSEICSVYLMPRRFSGQETYYDRNLEPPPSDPSTLAIENANEWWNGDPTLPLAADAFELTGDNLRESPYNQVYPRLCTRSNVFKVHYRVQLLGKSRATRAPEWDLSRERIVAEQRGSAVIERFIDPNNPNLPDFANETSDELALDDFYRYRVIQQETFAP